MQYTVTRGEKGKVEIKVDVSAKAFDVDYTKVAIQFSKEAKIPGFRPGQAPEAIVEQHIGLNRILNETASFLISKYLSEIFKKEEIVPIGNPKIAVNSLSKGQPFSFVATFYQRPPVKIGDWKKVKIKKAQVKPVTEEETTESVENIYKAWKKRKLATTEGTEEKTEGTESSKKFIYDAHGNKIFIKDEESKSKSKPSFAKASEGEIDDEFAKAVGAYDLANLRELVRKDLAAIVAENVESKFEDEMFEKILAICEVEPPEILVEDELDRMLARLNSQLESQKMTLDQYLAEQKTTLDGLKAKWRPLAEKNVKVTLILNEIGKVEKVEVAREEIDGALKGINQTNLSSGQKADLERYIAVSIFQAKTLDLVKKTAAS